MEEITTLIIFGDRWSSLRVPMQPTDDLPARLAGDPESRIVR